MIRKILAATMLAAAVAAPATAFADDASGSSAPSLTGNTAKAGGIGSGNVTQIPLELQGNFCGQTYNAIMSQNNPAEDNVCLNG